MNLIFSDQAWEDYQHFQETDKRVVRRIHELLKDITKTRLIVDGNHVEQWLNGKKVVAYEIGSKEWHVHVKTSKFINSKTYGRAPKGHLCLQDYGFPIEFRNIKRRELPAKAEH